MVPSRLSETLLNAVLLGYPQRRSRSPSSGRQGGGIGLVFVFDAKEPSAAQGRLAMAGALESACGGHSAVTPERVSRSRPAASVPGYPLLAGQADSVRKRAMSPIVLPWNERTAAERGVVSRVRSSGLPRTPGPSQNTPARREWQEVGTSGTAPRGPSLGGPRAPPRTARLARGSRRSAGGRGRPARGGRPGPGRADHWGGELLQVQRRGGWAGPCPHPPVGRRLRPLPFPGNSPHRAAPGPGEGAAAGLAGLGGAARARPPGRGSPRASTCRGARGAGSPADAFIAAAAAAAAAAASSFLLSRPLLGLGGGLRAPS